MGIPLVTAGWVPGVEDKDEERSKSEAECDDGEARNGSQGLATLGDSESDSPNMFKIIYCWAEEIEDREIKIFERS